jgi:hypothetical protein
LTISIMEALWATILFSGFALEVIIHPLRNLDTFYIRLAS